MNPQNLLEQFLGSEGGSSGAGAAKAATGKTAGGGLGGIAGGVAAGGLLGLLVGNKKARKKIGKLAGGVAGYGGAAALGALAYRAYQNWQGGQQVDASPTPARVAQAVRPMLDQSPPEPLLAGSKFLPATAPARDGNPFELALVLAMVAAANADGHVGPDERRLIFERANQLSLDAEDKGFIFDALAKPPTLQDIAGFAQGPEQAAELYLASRLAIDPEDALEQAYLEALANRLSLPPELVTHLENQAMAVAAGAD